MSTQQILRHVMRPTLKVPRAKKSLNPKRRKYVALWEIRRLQQSTDTIIPRCAFRRVVDEITSEVTGGKAVRFSRDAVEALQESAEAHMVEIFRKSQLCAIHGGRITVTEKDLRLTEELGS